MTTKEPKIKSFNTEEHNVLQVYAIKRKKPKTRIAKIERQLRFYDCGGTSLFGEVKTYDKKKDRVHVYVCLGGDIGPVGEFENFMAVLRLLKKGDKLDFEINSPGGRVCTGIQLVNHIRSCPALTRGIASGMVASMAPFLWLSCDEVELQPHALIMFHPAQSLSMGSLSNMKKYSSAIVEQLSNMFRDICPGYLTEKEVVEMANADKEFWITTKQAKKRLRSFRKATGKKIIL